MCGSRDHHCLWVADEQLALRRFAGECASDWRPGMRAKPPKLTSCHLWTNFLPGLTNVWLAHVQIWTKKRTSISSSLLPDRVHRCTQTTKARATSGLLRELNYLPCPHTSQIICSSQTQPPTTEPQPQRIQWTARKVTANSHHSRHWCAFVHIAAATAAATAAPTAIVAVIRGIF